MLGCDADPIALTGKTMKSFRQLGVAVVSNVYFAGDIDGAVPPVPRLMLQSFSIGGISTRVSGRRRNGGSGRRRSASHNRLKSRCALAHMSMARGSCAADFIASMGPTRG